MCLPVSRLFWVSSLAYPNLLGTKGYVVVVTRRRAMYHYVKKKRGLEKPLQHPPLTPRLIKKDVQC
jgi:hypothetical protein